MTEVIASFVQDKTALERGLFDEETIPQELTQIKMGKIIRDKYPDLDEVDNEAVRQHAIIALNLVQQSKPAIQISDEPKKSDISNTALIDGVRRFAMDVRDLEIDLIDQINPFKSAYSILARTINADTLQQVATVIAGRRVKIDIDEARDLAKRALKFKQEHKRLPDINAHDSWERRMAEGVAVLARMKADASND